MLLIEFGDKAAARHGEERNGIGVFRLRAAHNHFLDAAISAGDQVGFPEEKAASANGSDNLHIGSSLANEFGVVVLKILAGANALGQAGGVRTGGKAREEVGPRAERFHLALHEVVEAVNDGGHGNHGGNADDDAEDGQGGANLGGAQGRHRREEIFASLRKGHYSHYSDLMATTGSRRDARNAG